MKIYNTTDFYTRIELNLSAFATNKKIIYHTCIMILIIGSNSEVHSKYVCEKLLARGEDVEYFDTRKIPNKIMISWNASEKNFGKGYFKIDNKKIFFSDIKSVYWRNHYGYFQPIAKHDENLNYILQREIRSAFDSAFASSDWLWCNHITAIEMHKKKTYQLNVMAKNDIRVPNTIITNNKEDLDKFIEENGGKIIFKPVLGGAATQSLTKDDLNDELLDTLQNSPVQFQEFVEGTDIRTYVVGDKIFAAKIIANTIDFREDKKAKIIPVELPKNIQDDCLKIMSLMNLNYSGIDIRLSNKGEYVFIEANPAPMFIHFENQTGFPISDTLCELLIR